MKKSTNLGECLHCFEVYCKTCSDADASEDFCSSFCEDMYETQSDIDPYDIAKDFENEI